MWKQQGYTWKHVAVSLITKYILGEEDPSRQVASENDSAIRAKKQPIDDKHVEMRVDGTQNAKIDEEIISPCGKRKSI